jgi:hypothetical protein
LTFRGHNDIVVLMIPDFAENGNLPPGQHLATWGEVEQKFGWTRHRRELLQGLKEAISNLKIAGCKRVYLDGSFVTKKTMPGDFDACWEIEGVDPAILDPVLLDFGPGRRRQKERFGGELFPSHWKGDADKIFIEFFQRDRETGAAKGIVAINLEDMEID